MMHGCFRNSEVFGHFLQRKTSCRQFLEDAQAAFVSERFGKFYQASWGHVIICRDTFFRYWIAEDDSIVAFSIGIPGPRDVGGHKDDLPDARLRYILPSRSNLNQLLR